MEIGYFRSPFCDLTQKPQELADSMVLRLARALDSAKTAGIRNWSNSVDYDDRSWHNSAHDDDVLIVWDLSSYAGYDWWCYAIVLNSRGEYAFYCDSGCSCNSAYEQGWDKYDLAWTTDIAEIKRQAREYVGKSERISVGRKAENLAKLAKLSA